jgi:hypothetical protein
MKTSCKNPSNRISFWKPSADAWMDDKTTGLAAVVQRRKPRDKFNATSILSAPEMWPSLTDALIMNGVEAIKELDFEKLAEHFNKIPARRRSICFVGLGLHQD